MNPTEKLYILIELSHKATNINKVLDDIEKAIKEGAILDKEYYNYTNQTVEYIPILYAILLDSPLEVIKILKSYYWINKYKYPIIYSYAYMDEYELFIKFSIHNFINKIYSSKRTNIKKYNQLFDINIIEDDIERHNYLMSQTYRIDNE